MTVQTMLTNATHVSQKQSSTETMWVNDQRTNSERVPCRPAIVKVPPWDSAACARSEPLQSPRPRTRTPWLLHPSACCFVTPAPIPEDLKYPAPGHAGELERTCLCRQLPDFCYGMGSHRVFLPFWRAWYTIGSYFIWYWYPLPYYWSPGFVPPMPGRSNL